MIQRIQTVLLILAVGLNVAFVFTPLFEDAFRDPSGWISSALIAALVFAVVFCLFSIIIYKKRTRQIHWIKRAMLFQIIALGCGLAVIFTLGGIGSFLWDELISLGMILVGLVLQYGAIHYIKRDENLVRSMDRIR